MDAHGDEQFDLYPFYVTSAEQKARYDICKAIAERVSAENEPSGVPDTRFVWCAARDLYRSDIPMGDPADAEPAPAAEVEPSAESPDKS